MKSIYALILILIASSVGLVIGDAYGNGQWVILRNDDFVRGDGVEGNLQDVHFTDAQHGWAVGSQGLILHTADGGKTWKKKEVEMQRPVDLWNLYFKNKDIGFITGVGGVILMTKNGGQTWESKSAVDPNNMRDGQPVPVRRRFTDTWMVDDKVGFMVGENNSFIKTTDGGETWEGSGERVAVGDSRNNLEKIYFGSATHGWIVGSFGTLKHTSDGGETWEDQIPGVDNNLIGVHFVDEKTGWVSGQEGVILHTQDGGATWTQQETESYDTLYDIKFVDRQTGWAVGDFGSILHTTDGGKTWARAESGTSTTLYAVDATDKNRCWAIGEWGLILGYVP